MKTDSGRNAGRRWRSALLSIAALLFLLAVTGCWNSRELNQLAIVTAMSVDKAEGSDQYDLAFQVVMPGEIMSSSKSGSGNAPFSVYTVRSKTLFEGIRKASKQVPRQLFFSHIEVVILGERLAESGIAELFDFFERSHEVRLTSMLLVARGDPTDKLISTIVPLAPLQSEALMGASEFSARIWSGSPVIGIDDVIRKLINPGAEPSISGLRLVGDGMPTDNKQRLMQTRLPYHLEISGVAAFREGKLAGWLDNGQARGYMFIADRMRSTVMNLPCEDKPDGIALEVVRSRTRTKVTFREGRAKVEIAVNAVGNVAEVQCGVPLQKLEEIDKLEHEWSQAVKADMMAAVKRAQTLRSDVFAFGEALQRSQPKAWKSVAGRWGDVFAEADVAITFKGQILRTGMRAKSLLEKS
ncbi:spore germination protein KC [Paenibacillus sp. UNC496MF]|uniref:Ger(x)C family spore germination protein n=1 Tax=Paenibacillus sp. UNC496MF TaxID=1502753 RepID=UPI0008EB6BF0|nr:Ger(x)C family spore germination protein [Paenibacillus sp. UNC496MF]SFI86191.1 spore germination protein KC [Paenibacillus sp. UNC496MF]